MNYLEQPNTQNPSIILSRVQKTVNYINWQALNGRFPNSPNLFSCVHNVETNNPVVLVKYLNEYDSSILQRPLGTAYDYNGLVYLKNLTVDLKDPINNSEIISNNIDIVEPFANNLMQYNFGAAEETSEANYPLFLPIPNNNKSLGQITDEITSLNSQYINTSGKIKTFSFELTSNINLTYGYH